MTDNDLRDLFEDAVSDVEPRKDLDALRARIMVPAPRVRRPLLWTASGLTAAAATFAVITAVTDAPTGSPAASGQVSGHPGSSNSVFSGPVSSATGAPQMGPDLVSVPVYYVGTTSRGPRLYREFHKVRADLDAAVAAVNEALHVSSIDKDYSSAWWAQGGPVVDSVTHANGVISVALSADQDLSTRPPGMSAALATMSLQQIVYTVQAALQSTDPVQLTVNAAAGGTTDQIFGIPTAQPLTRGSAVDTLAQVWIIDPGEHTRVPRRFTVHGVAAAFEATVVWELLRGGTVVRHGAAMTQQSGTMSPFTFTVHAPPGAYTLMVRDTDPSGGEGFAPWRDTKRVRVVG